MLSKVIYLFIFLVGFRLSIAVKADELENQRNDLKEVSRKEESEEALRVPEKRNADRRITNSTQALIASIKEKMHLQIASSQPSGRSMAPMGRSAHSIANDNKNVGGKAKTEEAKRKTEQAKTQTANAGKQIKNIKIKNPYAKPPKLDKKSVSKHNAHRDKK